MRDFSLAVYIGRFQPFHNGHKTVIERGLEVAGKVLIVIGSKDAASNTKNPFRSNDRAEMIAQSFDSGRISFVTVRDYFYSDSLWLADVLNKVHMVEDNDARICLIGSFKDGTSKYLTMLPWHHEFIRATDGLEATNIRDIIFSGNSGFDDVAAMVPKGTFAYLQRFWYTEDHARLIKEKAALDIYRRDAKSYPPIFVTTDAVVTKSGHILLVRRGGPIGSMLYALPGGFVKQDELLLDGALRELKEETNIQVPKETLRSKLKSQKVFDYPYRSERGRIITHAFYFDLGDGELPRVHGGDDATEAVWVSMQETAYLDNLVFEDHVSIFRSL